MEIQDRVVIVTGASHGIGLATARALGGAGAKVALAARSADVLSRIATGIPGSIAVVADLRRREDIGSMVREVEERFGRIDVLVNVAGQGMFAPVERIDIDQLREIMELNVYGPLLTMQAVIPLMRAQGSGMIVNVSSNVTTRYVPNLAGYAATKYALNALTLTARQELEPDGIIVSLIRPKLVQTEFGRRATVPEPDSLRAPGSPVPIITPEEVGEAIVALIRSEEAEAAV